MTLLFEGPRGRARSLRYGGMAVCAAFAAASPTRAETLAEAIALAYDANPTLQSQRAQLRATDEGYVQAEAGWRPTLSAGASVTHSRSPQAGIFGGTSETVSEDGSLALSATQPLYTGGRVGGQVSVAEAQIHAGREQLRATEGTVLFDVVQAYEDVLRDRSILQIERESLVELQAEYAEIDARVKAGANSTTDLAQAGAQVEIARALSISAASQLDVSNAEYVSVVGQSPGSLTAPGQLADVPGDIDAAFQVAEDENATLRQAEFTEAGNRAQIQVARAAERPTVSFTGQYGEESVDSPFDHHMYDHAASVTLNVNQPIFAGGTIRSQIRQAVEQDTSARLQVEATRRTVIQNVSQAYSQNRSAHANVAVDLAQVKVAEAAYEGLRVEYRAGLRSTLDVLYAQQTLRDAKVSLAQAAHDDYVGEAALLNAVGRLEARVVVQGVPLYQPQATFRRVETQGGVPWQVVPQTLDHIGSPALDEPRPIPQPETPKDGVRLTPAAGPTSTLKPPA